MTIEEARNQAVAVVKSLSEAVGIPKTLTEVGFDWNDVEQIAADALADVCTGGNPRETNIEDIIALYKELV